MVDILESEYGAGLRKKYQARECDAFLLGISRQAVYQRAVKRKAVLAPVKEMIMNLRRFMPRFGTRKLYYLIKFALVESGVKLGRDGLFDYLRDANLLVRPGAAIPR